MNRWEIEKEIAMKALKDPAFKKRLLLHPKEAIAEILTGDQKKRWLTTMDDSKITVREEERGEWILPIPYIEKGHNISDADLRNIAAGQHSVVTHHVCC